MYRAPLREMRFVLQDLLGGAARLAAPQLADYSDDLAQSVLEEAARFAQDVLEPLTVPGTRAARAGPRRGHRSAGLRRGVRAVRRRRLASTRGGPEFGGTSVPRMLITAVQEFWGSANLAFKLCPMLTQAACMRLSYRLAGAKGALPAKNG